MKKSVNKKILVLVPHKDVRTELHNYCEVLVKNGLTGVYRFPLVVPLAEISQSLTDDELKKIAFLLRQITGKSKINSIETSKVLFPAAEDKLMLLGPQLDLRLPEGVFNDFSKIQAIYSPQVIGTFLFPDQSMQLSFKLPSDKLSFRAAAAANMYWKSFSDHQLSENTGYKWKIGKLSWLPKRSK